MKKRSAAIRIISYAGAVLLACAVILLILDIIPAPVEKSGPDKNQTEQSAPADQNEASQPASGNSGGDTPAPSSTRSSNIGQPVGPATGGAQTSPAPSRSSTPPAGNDPAPAPDPDPPQPSILDTLIDGVQNILPEGGIL